ncbi:copper oxidase [Lottiidibacillus patelloidae]|uniref:Copper oxidase n=1 Tax=Lottiidibacillus patelloidae TaxID=2670334 RepID=A0A263BTS9_9BACI|nr:multicopper oxidase domain-containing protein [Lottiidibacillus patelloidae]OZM57119.1 copper oxidase [Lottiidibacillus patelloidae]
MKRSYDIVAISASIVFNNFGDHDRNGAIYVLREKKEEVKRQLKENQFCVSELVQPLTIRANEGDEVEIHFKNELNHPASIHFHEADYDAQTSDGAFVGFNEDTTVPPNGEITYTIQANHEGIYFFHDNSDPDSSQDGTNIHGLFGALVVQKRGSWWTDPITGEHLNSGVYADIHHPFLPSFREYAWYFHDEQPVKDLTGNKILDPRTGQEAESTHAVNYRYEPAHNRFKLIEAGVVCPECDGEEVHHDSWAFGDPPTPILKGYRGDPAKIRVIHAGIKETHVFHYHVHQWFKDPKDINSEIIDSQAVSPQSHFTVEPFYGLGSLQGAIGDVIIHCHLYPHFDIGMWGMNRIFDTLQDGSQCYPNGEPIAALQPLPDRTTPPKPTKEKPGFPNFIPGKVGFKAPRPPLGIVGGRGMTELEKNAAVPNARPGAVFTDSCLGNPVVKEFNISVIQRELVYNEQGWHDPKGRLYVLDEDLDDVMSGKKEPEPLVIHAEAGSCIRINFTNRLPNVLDGDAFELVTRTYEVGAHVHFVKFDVLCTDGANVGWNYDSAVLPNETIRYEWYADIELKAFFYHDHLFANAQQNHGLFAGGVIHPRFSKFLSSMSCEEIDHGTQITVTNPLIPDYRDFTLFVQDFTNLFKLDGTPIEPPPFPNSPQDPGIFAVNYKNEPLRFRLGEDKDPAYSFSSFVKGDPCTPILQAYEGDSIRIHLFQGAHEESHGFNLHGLPWKYESRDVNSKWLEQQHIGISESFTLQTFIPRNGDYLWAFETEEDVWTGTWGLVRAFANKHDHLIPLLDREELPDLAEGQCILPEVTGKPPAPPKEVLSTGPDNAPVRKYHVVAFQTPIKYNEFGDHDPYGIVFALEEDVDEILNGKNPEPLVLRGNAGDVIEVTLENKLKKDLFPFPDGIHPYPDVKDQAFYPPSLRISLHPQLLDYDVKSSAGETVGFNPDQTVEPGNKITYRWYVESSHGACGLWDMADLRNHLSFGTFGMFIAEPKGTTYHEPTTLEKVHKGTSVVLKHPLLPDVREFALLMHDGVRLEDKNKKVIIDPADGILGEDEESDLFDTFDNGSRGFNYRSARLINRLNVHPVKKDLFNSDTFGDPPTPIFEAYRNDPVVLRLVCPAERKRSHTFHLHGHSWLSDDKDIGSSIVSIEPNMLKGHCANIKLLFGAGGINGFAGDYMYRSGNFRWDLELGMWGIMRVHERNLNNLAEINNISADSKEEKS